MPSIEHFLNNECVITQFDADVVKVNDFKLKYLKFCEVNRLDSMVITRSLMNRYAIESTKLELTFVQRKGTGDTGLSSGKGNTPAAGGAGGLFAALNCLKKCKTNCVNRCMKCCGRKQRLYAINEDRMEEKLHQLALSYLHERSRSVKKASPFTRLWCLYDILSVFLHLVAILFFTFVPIALVFFEELTFGIYQSTVYQDKYEVEDVTVAPWNLPLKIPLLSVWNKVLLVLSAIYLVLALVELIVYYRYMSFPIDTLRHFDPHLTKKHRNCLQIVVQALQWIYLFFIIG